MCITNWQKQALELKAANYESLKEWDKKREETLGFHRRTIENLIGQIEKRIKQSEAYMQSLCDFL